MSSQERLVLLLAILAGFLQISKSKTLYDESRVRDRIGDLELDRLKRGQLYESSLEDLRVDHKRWKRSLDATHYLSRHRRSLDNDTYHLVAQKCFTAAELQSEFNIDVSQGSINDSAFKDICPELLEKFLEGECENVLPFVSSITQAEIYGYGSLAVFIIALGSLIGLCFIPCFGTVLYVAMLSFFVALAVGALIGDAFLHLIPMATKVHNHGFDFLHGDHGDIEHIVVEDFILKNIVVIAAIYILFLFEGLLSTLHVLADDNPGYKSHDEGMKEAKEETSQTDADEKTKIVEKEGKQPKAICNVRPVVFMVLIGDGIHNFADGIAIGAAFTQDINTGIAVSIAMLAHEVPHEVGDFAILVESGLHAYTALGWNFLSSLTAFAGLYTGIAIGDDPVVRQWIFAVVAGIFVYIALAEMVPELRRMKAENPSNKYLIFFIQNLGFLVGIGIILTISIFEEHIEV